MSEFLADVFIAAALKVFRRFGAFGAEIANLPHKWAFGYELITSHAMQR